MFFFDLEKCDKENTAAGERDITPPSNNQSIQPKIQDQSVWGNRTDGDLIRSKYFQNKLLSFRLALLV